MITANLGYGPRGLGDLIPKPNYENCDPRDSACVTRNQVLNDQWAVDNQQAQADNNYNECIKSGDIARCQAQRDIQTSYAWGNTADPNSGSGGGGQRPTSLNFTTSRSGGVLYPGDTWTISIGGARANSPVTSYGNSNGVSYGPTNFGNTDSGGNWSKSGTITNNEIGGWVENWAVGGQNLGLVQFVVRATPPANTPATPDVSHTVTQSNSDKNPTVTQPQTNTTNKTASSGGTFDLFGDTSTPIDLGVFQIGTYTALGLAAAVVVGVMMMSRGRR
jgi:hypothetical protein